AVVLLRDVGQTQEVCKRPCHGQRLGGRQRRQQVRQAIEVVTVSGASAFGERPYALDHLEELGPLLGAQRPAEEIAEEVDVVAEGLVGRIGHRRSVAAAATTRGAPIFFRSADDFRPHAQSLLATTEMLSWSTMPATREANGGSANG